VPRRPDGARRTERVAAIVLAAGASRRFGAPKLLADLGGKPLVRWAVEHALASHVDETLVVLGREADAVRGALAGLPVRYVENARWADGMSSSLHAGVAALPGGVRAAVFVLGDQPWVAPDVIDRLVHTHRVSGVPIVVPVYAGERGNPVLIDALLFRELRAVTGDEGARALIARDANRVARVDFDFPMPADVDTPADLEMARRVVP
jgi:molybdenum cofactor cytidylyltransferase